MEKSLKDMDNILTAVPGELDSDENSTELVLDWKSTL